MEVENINLVTQKLWGFLAEEKRSFLIDEIGKMEYFSREFRELIRELFHNPEARLIATIAEKDFHPEIRVLKEKGELYYLTRKNFDEVLSKVLRF